MPSWELFDAQGRRAAGTAYSGRAPRIGIEAASTFGWTRYVATEDDVIGLHGFGASGPAKQLYERFGTTRDAIVARALDHIRS